MNFDELQNQWKRVVAPAAKSSDQLNPDHDIDKHLRITQRKTINSNILMTLGFAFSFSVLLYVRADNPERNWAFFLSIDMMLILMLITAIVFWNRVLFWKNPYDMPTKAFIEHFEKKLRLRKFLLNVYMPAYTLILASAINLYYTDILTGVENTIKISVYSITNLYFIIVHWLGSKHQFKKEARLTEPIIKNLNQIKNSLFDENEHINFKHKGN